MWVFFFVIILVMVGDFMNTVINIKVDKDVKNKADVILDRLGVNMSDAFEIFLRQIIRDNGVPNEFGADVLADMDWANDFIDEHIVAFRELAK